MFSFIISIMWPFIFKADKSKPIYSTKWISQRYLIPRRAIRITEFTDLKGYQTKHGLLISLFPRVFIIRECRLLFPDRRLHFVSRRVFSLYAGIIYLMNFRTRIIVRYFFDKRKKRWDFRSGCVPQVMFAKLVYDTIRKLHPPFSIEIIANNEHLIFSSQDVFIKVIPTKWNKCLSVYRNRYDIRAK